ncbi:hypothetical protein C0989_008793 [Termitomyces sp. Mn162]|nr:hypothetical protein C0989_008793 [Termitomyces sp. Mn162]
MASAYYEFYRGSSYDGEVGEGEDIIKVKNPQFKMESNEVVSAPRIKIIACKNGDAIEAGKK